MCRIQIEKAASIKIRTRPRDVWLWEILPWLLRHCAPCPCRNSNLDSCWSSSCSAPLRSYIVSELPTRSYIRSGSDNNTSILPVPDIWWPGLMVDGGWTNAEWWNWHSIISTSRQGLLDDDRDSQRFTGKHLVCNWRTGQLTPAARWRSLANKNTTCWSD